MPISHKRNGGFQRLGELDVHEDTRVNAASMVDENICDSLHHLGGFTLGFKTQETPKRYTLTSLISRLW